LTTGLLFLALFGLLLGFDGLETALVFAPRPAVNEDVMAPSTTSLAAALSSSVGARPCIMPENSARLESIDSKILVPSITGFCCEGVGSAKTEPARAMAMARLIIMLTV
jgi:hypothetical protein